LDCAFLLEKSTLLPFADSLVLADIRGQKDKTSKMKK